MSKLEQTDSDPSWSTVQSLATALGVEVADFLAGPDDTESPPAEPEPPPKKPAGRGKK